jgi:hypothetical protein
LKFSETLDLMGDSGNPAVVLQGRKRSRRVLCAPTLVGRVLTSTFDGPQGEGLGWVGVDAILKGPVNPVINNFGGEERFWIGPEGSQFGLHFGNQEQTFANYRVPPAMNSQPYEVLGISRGADFVVMRAHTHLRNAADTEFDIDVTRTIKIADDCPYVMGRSGDVDFVGFQSETAVKNVSEHPIRRETGALAAWTPGLFPNGPKTTVIVPFRIHPEVGGGEAIRQDYIKDLCEDGQMPAHAWRIADQHALLRADGRVRTKIGVGKRHALNRLGSLDVETGLLTLVTFELYPEMDYVAPYWRHLSNHELFDGEAVSVYLDGPAASNRNAGDFYELETLSPALVLGPGESFLHRNRVYHLRGDLADTGAICQLFLKANVNEVKEFSASVA